MARAYVGESPFTVFTVAVEGELQVYSGPAAIQGVVGRDSMALTATFEKPAYLLVSGTHNEAVRLAIAVLQGDTVAAKILADKVLLGD